MSTQNGTYLDFFSQSWDDFPVSPNLMSVAGMRRDYDVSRSHQIVATKPVAVTPVLHYKSIPNGSYSSSTAQLPSVDQLLDEYVVYIPDSLWSNHMLTIAQPDGGELNIDGAPVAPTGTEAMPDGWVRDDQPARVSVTATRVRLRRSHSPQARGHVPRHHGCFGPAHVD